MAKPLNEMSSWSPSTAAREDDAWEATRQVGPATQLVGDQEDYLASGPRDVGRSLGDGQWELFVVCDAGEAMHLQFEHLKPNFIALHDVGTTSSRRLLAGLAAACQAPVHKLTVRRQGHGIALATIDFVELPVVDAAPLRLYSTEVDADTHSRHELARVLLAHSRLGVLMVGDLPQHALNAALDPLHKAMLGSGWRNRQLLVLPLSPAAAVAAQAAPLGHGSGVAVRTTPPVRRPAEAWSFITATWSRLREVLAATGTAVPEIAPIGARPPPAAAPVSTAPAPAAAAPAPAPTPLPMRPMPPLPVASAPVAESPFAAYVQQCSEIKGLVSCCVFELATQRPLAHAGLRPGPAVLAAQGAALYESMLDAGRQLGLAPAQPDAAITLAAHHLLLRPLPNHPGVALHAVLDRSSANLTLVRLQLQRLDAMFDAKA